MADTEIEMTFGAGASLLEEQSGKTETIQVFDSYAEAAAQAARFEFAEGFVAKIQRSPYGPGYIVRSVPVSFLIQPELRHRFAKSVGYSDL